MSDAMQSPSPVRRSRGRSISSSVLLVLAGLLLLLSSFAVWVNRVALNTTVFVDTSTELIEDDAIRGAVAQRAVDELYSSVDVEAAIRERLPDDVKQLAGPTAAALRQGAPEIVDRALQQPALQRLWEASIEQSHKTLVAVLEGDGDVVSTTGGVVTLDLRLIVLESAERMGIRSEVEDRLPANAGRIEVLRSDELDTAQDAFQLFKAIAWLLPILTLIAFAGAIWAARDKRSAVRGAGITLLVVGVLGLLVANLVGNYVVDALASDTETRDAAGNAWEILTELLRSSFTWLIPVGALLVVASWLAGPGRRATDSRRLLLAPALRQRAWAYVVLAVVGLFLLLTGPVTDFTRFLVVAVLVALGATWIEVTRAQTIREVPDTSAPELFDEARTRIASWWETLRTPAKPPTGGVVPPSDVSAQLANLADLHVRRELTDDEYAAAKARVLAG